MQRVSTIGIQRHSIKSVNEVNTALEKEKQPSLLIERHAIREIGAAEVPHLP